MGYPVDPNDLQYDQVQWSKATFPDEQVWGLLAHLKKEIDEIAGTIGNGSVPELAEEFADAYLLLIDAAGRCEIAASEIMTAAREKLEVNKRRKWGPLNADGFSEHVE